MWCILIRRMCSPSIRRSKVTRKSGPRCKSNGWFASSVTQRKAACSRSSVGEWVRSWIAMQGRSEGRTTCTGSPSSSANAVLRISCRRVTSWMLCSNSSVNQGALQTECHCNVVDKRSGLKPVEEPKTLFGERQPESHRLRDWRTISRSANSPLSIMWRSRNSSLKRRMRLSSGGRLYV